MKDQNRTRKALGEEIARLRKRVTELEQGEKTLCREERIRKALIHLGKKSSAAINYKQVARLVLKTADELIGWDAGFLIIYSEDEDNIHEKFLINKLNGRRKEVLLSPDKVIKTSIIKQIFKQGARLISRDTVLKRKISGLVKLGGIKHQSNFLMFTPIKKGNKNLGVLSIQSHNAKAYNKQDLEILRVLADYCCDMIERTIVQNRLKQSEEQLRLLTKQIPSLLWTTDKSLRLTSILG